MANGEIINARIERIAAGGAGLARPEGKTVFVELTAPGDLVRCRITNERKTWAEAELLEILEASPQRAEPVCPLYGRCGGCSFQHLQYEAQIEAKTAILREAFTRIGRISPPDIQVFRSEPLEYRNRVQFHAAEGGRPGFKERKSARVIALGDCSIADPGIRKALREGKLKSPPGKERFTVYSLGDIFLCEGAEERGKVRIIKKEFSIDVNVFFQSNAVMLEALIKGLIKAVISPLEGIDRFLPLADIYAGVGTFAAWLALLFPAVQIVEENPAALALARENIPRWALAGDSAALTDTAWAKSMASPPGGNDAGNGKRWGFMVLDPPRQGLSRPLSHFLAENGADAVAYVSCDPAALARDSRILLDGGYTLKELYLYDFYPQTAHIESLALFSRL